MVDLSNIGKYVKEKIKRTVALVIVTTPLLRWTFDPQFKLTKEEIGVWPNKTKVELSEGVEVGKGTDSREEENVELLTPRQTLSPIYEFETSRRHKINL